MADAITEQITEDIKTTLESMSTYGGTPTVERERLIELIEARYPFIVIAGPFSDITTQTTRNSVYKIEYVIKYFINENDESTSSDTEITYLTRNVNPDIIKALMADRTRGGVAIDTKPLEDSYVFSLLSEDTIEFMRFVRFEITARIDSDDPYNIA